MEYKEITEVKADGQFLKAICFKPKKAPVICGIAGLLMLAVPNLPVRILGVFFIAMSFAVLKYVRDFKVMDIFDKGVMIYGDEDARTACFIPFEDIKMWTVKHQDGHDMTGITLQDGSTIVMHSFEADKAYRTLNRLLKEKEERHLQKLEDRKRELSLPASVKNFMNKLGGGK